MKSEKLRHFIICKRNTFFQISEVGTYHIITEIHPLTILNVVSKVFTFCNFYSSSVWRLSTLNICTRTSSLWALVLFCYGCCLYIVCICFYFSEYICVGAGTHAYGIIYLFSNFLGRGIFVWGCRLECWLAHQQASKLLGFCCIQPSALGLHIPLPCPTT